MRHKLELKMTWNTKFPYNYIIISSSSLIVLSCDIQQANKLHSICISWIVFQFASNKGDCSSGVTPMQPL